MVFYKAVFEKDKNGYGISFPALEGCFSAGSTFEDAYANAQEALGLYITTLESNNEPVPNDVDDSDIKLTSHECLTMVGCDLEKYRPQKAVKKTLTIPYYLNEAAMQNNINFSKVLQDALKKQLNI